MRCGKPVRRREQEYCPDCEQTKSELTQGRSLWLHRGPVPGAVYKFKYGNRRVWGRIFAGEMARVYGDQICRWGIEVIIPVPLHRSRRSKRGFNQSEIIADELSRLTGIPARRDVLFRIRKTIPQKKLGRKGRKANLQGAFGVTRRWEPSRNVLLIDDIYTTGSTLERSAAVLKKAGVQNVYFLTISIGQGL